MRSRAEKKSIETSLYKTASVPCGKRGGQRERENLYRRHPLDYSVVNHRKPDEEISDPTMTPVKRYSPVSQSVRAYFFWTTSVKACGVRSTYATAYAIWMMSARAFCLPDAECQGIFLPDDEG